MLIENGHYHFIGIGGAGMAAIATILLDQGYTVSGSDVALQDSIERLRQKGAVIAIGHDANHLIDVDAVVFSTAVHQDNVEMIEARRRNLPILHRSEMLAAIMEQKKGIAIAGAHGKTTTTSMLAVIFEHAQKDPTFLIGGVVANLQIGAKAGKGEYVIAEADESDRSFLNYHPDYAIITNIEADHLEHYQGNFDHLIDAYRIFIQQVKPDGLVVANADDPILQGLLKDATSKVISYSIQNHEADYCVIIHENEPTGSRATLLIEGKPSGELRLTVAGKHNISNALATIAVARAVGIELPVILKALTSFQGAKRRLQVMYEDNDLLVIDDYAHHPTEIKTTLEAIRRRDRRTIAVFQPQRFTRTYHLFAEFARAFALADEVIITDIYSPAGEAPIEGVSAFTLTQEIAKQTHPDAYYCPSKEDVFTTLQKIVRKGDVVITMGAGDVWKVGERFSKYLHTL